LSRSTLRAAAPARDVRQQRAPSRRESSAGRRRQLARLAERIREAAARASDDVRPQLLEVLRRARQRAAPRQWRASAPAVWNHKQLRLRRPLVPSLELFLLVAERSDGESPSRASDSARCLSALVPPGEAVKPKQRGTARRMQEERDARDATLRDLQHLQDR